MYGQRLLAGRPPSFASGFFFTLSPCAAVSGKVLPPFPEPAFRGHADTSQARRADDAQGNSVTGGVMTVEEQIARLEELAYFQEKLLGQLNEALTGQQAQLDALEKRLAGLEENVSALLEASDGNAPANTLPPHYMPERY